MFHPSFPKKSPRPSSILRDYIGQLGLRSNAPQRLPAEHLIILQKIQNNRFDYFYFEKYEHDENEPFIDDRSSGNIVVLLADDKYRNQPPEELLYDIFNAFDIPAEDYLEMIASFFPVRPPARAPTRLRPTVYPESAADLRFPHYSNLGSVSGKGPATSMMEELCYKFCVVDVNPRSEKTSIRSTFISSATPLVALPKIHKCVVFMKSLRDCVVITTTYRHISDHFQCNRYLPSTSFDETVVVSTAQYVLADLGTVGWDICLDSIETGIERILQQISRPPQDHEAANGRRQMWDGLWEDLAVLQCCRSDIHQLMRANVSIISALRGVETAGEFNVQDRPWKQLHDKLMWQIDRAVTMEKIIDLGMGRVARRSQSEQESTNQKISMSSLKILFVFQTFSRSIAYTLLIFLPAIFASTLFSTWFFGPDGLDVAHQLWIFFAVGLPLTVLVLIFTGMLYRFNSGTWSIGSSIPDPSHQKTRQSV